MNTTAINAVAEAIENEQRKIQLDIIDNRSPSPESLSTLYAKAAIEAYEKVSAKEMTVDDMYKYLSENTEASFYDCQIISKALAKLGTILIVGGGE